MADRPPCPDPDRYIWVEAKKGGFWRKKRGTIKKAELNESFKRNAALTAVMNEAASRVLRLLSPYLDHMNTSGVYASIAGLLKKGYNKNQQTDYSYLQELNIQPYNTLESLIGNVYIISYTGKAVTVQIPVDKNVLRRKSSIISHYFFEVILLQGDVLQSDELMIESQMSDLYAVNSKAPDCILELYPTKKPWMILLKAGCVETPIANTVEFAVSPANYGMKVIAVG